MCLALCRVFAVDLRGLRRLSARHCGDPAAMSLASRFTAAMLRYRIHPRPTATASPRWCPGLGLGCGRVCARQLSEFTIETGANSALTDAKERHKTRRAKFVDKCTIYVKGGHGGQVSGRSAVLVPCTCWERTHTRTHTTP